MYTLDTVSIHLNKFPRQKNQPFIIRYHITWICYIFKNWSIAEWSTATLGFYLFIGDYKKLVPGPHHVVPAYPLGGPAWSLVLLCHLFARHKSDQNYHNVKYGTYLPNKIYPDNLAYR